MNYNVKRVSDRWLIFIILVILLGISGILWAYGNRLNTLWSERSTAASTTGAGNVSSNELVMSAIRLLYSNQAVTDPVNMRVYIPEAHIYLPMTDLSRSLYYYNVPASGSQPQAVSFNTTANLVQPLGSFSQVPCVQRMAGFTVSQQDNTVLPGSQYDSSYALSDGRTLYFYVNNNSGCKVRWSPQSPSGIVDLLKQAQPY